MSKEKSRMKSSSKRRSKKIKRNDSYQSEHSDTSSSRSSLDDKRCEFKNIDRQQSRSSRSNSTEQIAYSAKSLPATKRLYKGRTYRERGSEQSGSTSYERINDKSRSHSVSYRHERVSYRSEQRPSSLYRRRHSYSARSRGQWSASSRHESRNRSTSVQQPDSTRSISFNRRRYTKSRSLGLQCHDRSPSISLHRRDRSRSHVSQRRNRLAYYQSPTDRYRHQQGSNRSLQQRSRSDSSEQIYNSHSSQWRQRADSRADSQSRFSQHRWLNPTKHVQPQYRSRSCRSSSHSRRSRSESVWYSDRSRTRSHSRNKQKIENHVKSEKFRSHSSRRNSRRSGERKRKRREYSSTSISSERSYGNRKRFRRRSRSRSRPSKSNRSYSRSSSARDVKRSKYTKYMPPTTDKRISISSDGSYSRGDRLRFKNNHSPSYSDRSFSQHRSPFIEKIYHQHSSEGYDRGRYSNDSSTSETNHRNGDKSHKKRYSTKLIDSYHKYRHETSCSRDRTYRSKQPQYLSYPEAGDFDRRGKGRYGEDSRERAKEYRYSRNDFVEGYSRSRSDRDSRSVIYIPSRSRSMSSRRYNLKRSRSSTYHSIVQGRGFGNSPRYHSTKPTWRSRSNSRRSFSSAPRRQKKRRRQNSRSSESSSSYVDRKSDGSFMPRKSADRNSSDSRSRWYSCSSNDMRSVAVSFKLHFIYFKINFSICHKMVSTTNLKFHFCSS